MPRLKQELDLAVRIILATPNDEFSVRTLQCLREKFGTTPSRKKPRKINTQILTSLSMETGNEFVKAVYEARKGADEQVRSLWARVEKHLITWEIAGNPNASSRNMSARQRSYRSMSGFDIADLDQKGRDFLMLLAYARVDPMPRETFNGLQESFSWVLSSCKEARELLHEYLIKDKFLKRVYSATAPIIEHYHPPYQLTYPHAVYPGSDQPYVVVANPHPSHMYDPWDPVNLEPGGQALFNA